MSNRDSLGFGDLIPQDVVDIFAQEKHNKRGRKKRSHSLGRALGWLKRKKRKDLGANGQSLGLGPALDLALDRHHAVHKGGHKGGQKTGRQAHPPGNSHAVPKRDEDDSTPAAPLIQENVFIEASRPKYLEDLHSEAQEGLKMMQQEETNSGVEFKDDESTVSTITVQTDRDGGGFTTDSTIADTSSVVSGRSSVSTRSSRSGLTRQGSTFRPLNSGNPSEKAKTRRRHRRTVAGIPKHVQKELGLDRVGWRMPSRFEEEEFVNGETDTDGQQDAAQSDVDATEPISKAQVEQQLCAARAGHRDDLALLQRLGPDLSDGPRPRSLAVPTMTTANSLQPEPPSPVITMSPQAAYMSKIIPNAVLPPSIEVVEISRGRSRNSLRTVSKSSLLLSSPAPSRASSRASSTRTTSSRASTITSASRYYPHNLSDSSCWSNSGSSDTLVSDSSTISSSSTPRLRRSRDEVAFANEDKVSVHSSISKASKCTANGKLSYKADKPMREAPFVRSLSVIKHKRAPPPPNRSYSLHNKMKRRSRDLAEVLLSGESSLQSISAGENERNKLGSSPSLRIIDSAGYNGDTSSLDDSTGSVSFRLLKTQLPAPQTEKVSKDAPHEKEEPLQENKVSKVVSPSSGYSSQDCTSPKLSGQPHTPSPKHKRGFLAKLQRLFPGSSPESSAPSPLTQPEAHDKSTENPQSDTSVTSVSTSPSVRALRELFNIPPPPKVHAPPAPPPEVWAHNKRTVELLLGPPAPDNIYAIIKKNPKDRRQQRQPPSAEGSAKSPAGERKPRNATITADSVNGIQHGPETKTVQESGLLNAEIHKGNSERLDQNVDLKGSSKVTEKDERVSDMLNRLVAKTVEKREERLMAIKEEEAKKAQATLPAISLVRISPSPSPPPAHHPPQPHGTQTTEVKPVVSPESSWPPPPPPAGQVVSVPDDVDFPLPPPPILSEEVLVSPVQVSQKWSVPGAANIGQPASTTTLVISLVQTEYAKGTTEAEPPPVNIPPPPTYAAPAPPVKAASPPITEVIPPRPKDVAPPKAKDISPAPPKEVSPPPPQDLSPPPPQDLPPPPPQDISPTPPKEVSPQPPQDLPPPPPEDLPPTPPKKVSPPPPQDLSPTPPKEVSPPPLEKVSPVITVEPPPPQIQALPALVEDISTLSVQAVSPPPVQEVPPLVVEVPPVPPKAVSVLSYEEVALPSSQEDPPLSSEEVTPVCHLGPPQSIPPPPPVEPSPQSSPPSPEQQIDLPQEITSPESSTIPVSVNNILTPPESIPAPPPDILPLSQVAPLNTDSPADQEAPHPPTFEASLPSELSPSPEEPQQPPTPPLESPASISEKQSPTSTEDQSSEPTSAPVVQEEPTAVISPSLLQVVKLRAMSSSPEPPIVQDQAPAEVTMRTQQPSNPPQTSSVSSEAPQKPIRRSLILICPTATSPPPIITSQPAVPTSQSTVVPPSSSTTIHSPKIKSPPALTLQEVIRQRTAARSKDSPGSRLSLHSPTSPKELHLSPSSAASFVFSKSTKKEVMETQPAVEAKSTPQMNPQVSAKVGEAESLKKGVKMPPPVAKKPKTKAKEVETSEGMEQTAGQEAHPESMMDAAEKTNGTVAGTAEGGET